MGCITSKSDINDTHPNVFVVYNIDDASNKVSEGHLEVTDAHVLLHQRGKDPVRWPLKSLRRYGAEGEVFSFESGRKCETGPGIYAFRCRRAERLLAMLQEKVRSSSSSTAVQQFDDINLAAAAATAAAAAANGTSSDQPPVPMDSMHRSTLNRHQPAVVPSLDGPRPAPLTLPHANGGGAGAGGGDVDDPAVAMPDYANVHCVGGSSSGVEASDGYLVPNTPIALTFANGHLFHDGGHHFGREYENLDSGGGGGGQQIPQLPPKPAVSTQHAAAAHSASSSHKERVFFREEPENGDYDGDDYAASNGGGFSPQINYIAVDFESAAPASPGRLAGTTASPQQQQQQPNGTPTPPPPPLVLRGEYCTIDIDRTQALSHTARQQSHRGAGLVGESGGAGSTSPVGVRKTRHNSTLSELTAVGGGGFGLGLGIKRNSVISGD